MQKLLSDLGLDVHLPEFEAQGIDGDVLMTLSDSDLKELGVTLLGDRRRILAALPKSQESAATAGEASDVRRTPPGAGSGNSGDSPTSNSVAGPQGGGALAIIVGFFLPWIALPFIGTIGGLEFVRGGLKAEELGPVLVGLAPLAATGVLLALAKGRKLGALGIIAGAVPWLLTAYVVVKFGEGGLTMSTIFDILVEGTSYGLWLALAGGAVLIATSAKELQVSSSPPPEDEAADCGWSSSAVFCCFRASRNSLARPTTTTTWTDRGAAFPASGLPRSTSTAGQADARAWPRR